MTNPLIVALALGLAVCSALLCRVLVRDAAGHLAPGAANRVRLYQLLFGLIVLYGLGAVAYFVLRFGGLWSEGDTARITVSIAYAQQVGRVVPDPPGLSYANGLAYPALSLFLLELGGVSVQTLQAAVYPFIAVLIAFPLFALYRAFTQSTSIALLATFMLYLQPDFLFVTFRGSHEKLTWTLVISALLLLVKSFAARERPGEFARYVLLFYLAVFALVASNWFFAMSFIAALAFAFVGGMSLLGLRRRLARAPAHETGGQVRRLFYVTVSCSILLYMFVYTIYPPAQGALYVLGSLKAKLAALLLNFEVAFNPYHYISIAWLSPLIYAALTLFNYMVGLVSLAVWLRGLWRYLHLRELSSDELPMLLLWLAYAAFAAQMALSVLVDVSGVLSGNFEVRLFTPLMLTAVPLAALGIRQWLAQQQGGVRRRAAIGSVVLCAAWFSLASLLKITNEPSLSNQWTFYDGSEKMAGAWITSRLQRTTVWTGVDDRVGAALEFLYYPHDGTTFTAYTLDAGARFVLLSALERLKIARVNAELPDLSRAGVVYDNGGAQLYLRPALGGP